MYPAYLGRFNVPANDPAWFQHITFTPEPPIIVKGSLNPWADERQRLVMFAEEKAWKDIAVQQGNFNTVQRVIDGIIAEIQWKLHELERTTGKKTGLADAANYAALVYSLAGGPYAWAVTLAKFGIDFIVGLGVKKRAKAIIKELEILGAKIVPQQAKQAVIVDAINTLVQTGDALRVSQQGTITTDIQNAETAYYTRRQLDRQRADVLREHNRQVALLPRYPGGSDVL